MTCRAVGWLAAAAVVSGCSAGGEAHQPVAGATKVAAPPVQVVTAVAVRKSVPLEIDTVGTAEASSTVAVHAQVTGELTSVSFGDGDDVKKGQVLFTLDRRPLEAALQLAEANLQRDLAQATNARVQTKRYEDLAARGIATREQVEQSGTNAAALDATVAADRAAVDNAKVQLQYATLTAPISGRTGKLMVHAGNLVRANDVTPLVVINQVSPIHVSFSVPEGQLSDVTRRMAHGALRVEAQAPGDTETSSGHLSFVDNAVDQTTGTITMRGTFPNEHHRLWPGQFVNVVVTLGQDAEAVVVPTSAIQTGQQGSYVFIVKQDKTVEMKSVDVARTAGREAIVRTGVQPGESVVTDGQLRLVSGSRIAVRAEDGPGARQ